MHEPKTSAGCLIAVLAVAALLAGWCLLPDVIWPDTQFAFRFEDVGTVEQCRLVLDGEVLATLESPKEESQYEYTIRKKQRKRISEGPPSPLVVQVMTSDGWADLTRANSFARISLRDSFGRFALTEVWIDNRGGPPVAVACGQLEFQAPANAYQRFVFLMPRQPVQRSVLLAGQKIGELPEPAAISQYSLASATYLVDVTGTRSYRRNGYKYVSKRLPKDLAAELGGGLRDTKQFRAQHLHNIGPVDHFLERVPLEVMSAHPAGEAYRTELVDD